MDGRYTVYKRGKQELGKCLRVYVSILHFHVYDFQYLIWTQYRNLSSANFTVSFIHIYTLILLIQGQLPVIGGPGQTLTTVAYLEYAAKGKLPDAWTETWDLDGFWNVSG